MLGPEVETVTATGTEEGQVGMLDWLGLNWMEVLFGQTHRVPQFCELVLKSDGWAVEPSCSPEASRTKEEVRREDSQDQRDSAGDAIDRPGKPRLFVCVAGLGLQSLTSVP